MVDSVAPYPGQPGVLFRPRSLKAGCLALLASFCLPAFDILTSLTLNTTLIYLLPKARILRPLPKGQAYRGLTAGRTRVVSPLAEHRVQLHSRLCRGSQGQCHSCDIRPFFLLATLHCTASPVRCRSTILQRSPVQEGLHCEVNSHSKPRRCPSPSGPTNLSLAY